ncbi:MAG TPA: GNAT family N-acetyltransferase [Rhodopila sp.]|nr:GNAT family N-acetyltransferase [Rhodopila sp.]
MPSDERRSGSGYRLARPERQEDWHAFHKIRGDAFQLRRPEEISDPNCHPLLLWHEDRPVGAIQIDNLANQAAALRLVAIDPPWQACGHGRALLEQAESYVKDLGCRKAVVYATPEAAGFYSSAGYAEEDWDDTCLGGIVQMLKVLD